MLRFELASDGAPDAPVPADDEVVLQLVDARCIRFLLVDSPKCPSRTHCAMTVTVTSTRPTPIESRLIVNTMPPSSKGWTSRNPTVVSVMTVM